jgi:formylmethanofuran dehydrogenase subunit C
VLRLIVRLDSPIPVEADAVTPDRLADLPQDEVEKIPVLHGNQTVPLGKVFRAVGLAFEKHIEILGDCSRIKNLGRGMTTGTLDIYSDVGMHAGAGMRGGELLIHGDAGDWLGAEMRGGSIHVHGNAGNCVGAAYRGDVKGMRGGVIRIDGDAGHEVGSLMRRGLIVVGGRCGDFAGAGMIAGSLFAFGGVGGKAGAGMKRGTIFSGRPAELPPTFSFDCEYRPAFLQLYFRHLRDRGVAMTDEFAPRAVRRYRGDRLADGQGEVFVPA